MQKHPQSLLVGVILFASISCGGEIGQEDQSQTLRDTREAVAQAIAEGDVEQIFSFWADDMVIYNRVGACRTGDRCGSGIRAS